MYDLAALVLGRDDIWFKVPYARELLDGGVGPFARLLYAEHLEKWNSFSETTPRKSGLADFESHFLRLSESLQQEKFDPSLPIAVNDFGQGVGASHRLSLLVASLEIGKDFGAPHFCFSPEIKQEVSFGSFAGLGVNGQYISRAVLEKINFFEEQHLPVLIVWPRATIFFPGILEILRQWRPTLGFGLRAIISGDGLRNLVYLAYGHEAWAKNLTSINGKFSEISGVDESNWVIVLPLEPATLNELAALKKNIRNLWNHNFQGVHITNSRAEAISIWSSMCSPSSLRFLQKIKPEAFIASGERLLETRTLVLSAPSKTMGTVVVGSQWLDLLDIKKPRDVDLLYVDSAMPMPTENSNQYLRHWLRNPRKIILSPRLHVWVLGLKFWSPWTYLTFSTLRRERKDFQIMWQLRKSLEYFEQTPRRLAYFWPGVASINLGMTFDGIARRNHLRTSETCSTVDEVVPEDSNRWTSDIPEDELSNGGLLFHRILIRLLELGTRILFPRV